MLNFGQQIPEKEFSGEVIPKNTLVWCVLSIREIKNSKETNGRYLDCELTVYEGQPFAGRKMWDKIADPYDNLNSEEWRLMAYQTIRRILEATKGANPSQPNSYSLNQLTDLNGSIVPVLVGVEKGNDRYPDDKNKVEYLSPFSTVKKIVEAFTLLQSGVHEYAKAKTTAAPQQGNMFTGTATPPPPAMMSAPSMQAKTSGPAWLAPQQSAPATPAGSIPAQGQGQGGLPSGNFQQGPAPALTGAPVAVLNPSQGLMTKSPSNPVGQPGVFPALSN